VGDDDIARPPCPAILTDPKISSAFSAHLSLSEERSESAEGALRERCNARRCTTADSFNLNSKTQASDSQQHRRLACCKKQSKRSSARQRCTSPVATFGWRRPLLGQGEVKTERRSCFRAVGAGDSHAIADSPRYVRPCAVEPWRGMTISRRHPALLSSPTQRSAAPSLLTSPCPRRGRSASKERSGRGATRDGALSPTRLTSIQRHKCPTDSTTV